MNADQIKVKKGDNIRDAWERLVLWVESLKIVNHPDVKFRVGPHGIQYKINHPNKWAHPWMPSAFLGDREGTASVTTGTVNGIVPKIMTSQGLRRIDNRDDNGDYESTKDAPTLKLKASMASKRGEVYILLKVKNSLSAKAFEVKAAASGEPASDALEIVLGDSPTGAVNSAFSYYPLAMIQLNAGRDAVENVFPIVFHNLRFTYQERDATATELKDNPDKPRLGRGIFYPT